MYLFLLFAPFLGALLLFLLIYPREDLAATRRAALFGLALSLPAWLLARLASLAIPAIWGSPLFILHEWVDRFLPYSLVPALAYLIFYRYREMLGPGEQERRLTAFYAGVLAPFGLFEMIRAFGNPNAYTLLVLPFLLAAIVLGFPPIVIHIAEEYGSRRILPILGGLAATFALSAVAWLFLARLWPLALSLAALLSVGAWLLAKGKLRARATITDTASQAQ